MHNASNSTVPMTFPANPTNSTGKNGTNGTQPSIGKIDIQKDGNFSVVISAKEPCYLTLINNNKQTDLNWTISGTNVSADIMKMSFPFTTSRYSRVQNFTMPTTNDIVFLYIGATTSKDQAATISWTTPKLIPVTPVTPPGDAASFLK